MMLYPAMGELSAQIHNRYMLVNVVARRARQIAEAYEEASQKLEEKPVTIAINEVANGVLEDPEQMAPEPEFSADAADNAENPEEAEEGDEEELPDDAESAETEAETEGKAEAE